MITTNRRFLDDVNLSGLHSGDFWNFGQLAKFKQLQMRHYLLLFFDFTVIQHDFVDLLRPPLFSTKMKKRSTSQPELLFHEILHLAEPLNL